MVVYFFFFWDVGQYRRVPDPNGESVEKEWIVEGRKGRKVEIDGVWGRRRKELKWR